MPGKQALLDDLHRLASELDEPPTSRDVREQGEFSLTTYRSTFGSWSNALEAAGFSVQRSGQSYSTEALLDEIQRLADDLGHPPTQQELRKHGKYSISPYRDRFGSWSAALDAAGLEGRRPEISREDLLDELNRLANALDRRPTSEDMREQGSYSVETYRRRFGSWGDALEAAGIATSSKRIPEEELIAELQRLGEEFDAPPTQRITREHGKYSPTTYANRFGSWRSAVETAGFEPRVRGEDTLTKESLIEELQHLAADLGHPPSLQDLRDHSSHSATTYYDKFGSWRSALQAAGFADREPQQAATREELVAELQRLAEEYDQRPTTTLMDEEGEYWASTYRIHFDSWEAALKAAGLSDKE